MLEACEHVSGNDAAADVRPRNVSASQNLRKNRRRKKRQAQRANVPPLDSAKNDAKTGNGRQKHEKDRNKAMPISLSYAYFTLNNSHFSLLKKERDKLAPGARFARSGGPLAASFFLQKREMRVVECKISVAKGG